jgi:hypothetical protein
MSGIERSEPDETTREWVTGLLGRTPEAESIVRHIEWLDREAARQSAAIRGAVGEAERLRGGLQAALDYLELVPDDSVDYEAALIRVRAALDGQG